MNESGNTDIKYKKKKSTPEKKPQTKATIRTDDHTNKKLEFLLKANTSFSNHKRKVTY